MTNELLPPSSSADDWAATPPVVHVLELLETNKHVIVQDVADRATEPVLPCGTDSTASTTLTCGEPSPGSFARAMRFASNSDTLSGTSEIVSARGAPVSLRPVCHQSRRVASIRSESKEIDA